jgi:hypothetical protein
MGTGGSTTDSADDRGGMQSSGETGSERTEMSDREEMAGTRNQ